MSDMLRLFEAGSYHPIDTTVLDFDNVIFVPSNGGRNVWDPMRRDLASWLIENKCPAVNGLGIEGVMALYESEQKHAGSWSKAFESLGGNSNYYFERAVAVEKAPYAQHDRELELLIEQLTLYSKVIVFSGSTSGVVERALNVIITQRVRTMLSGIVGADTFGNHRKPDSEAYDALISCFKLDPNMTVMADDQKREIDQAKAHGMKTIWVNREGNIRRLYALPKVLWK